MTQSDYVTLSCHAPEICKTVSITFLTRTKMQQSARHLVDVVPECTVSWRKNWDDTKAVDLDEDSIPF
jgi:hypothetical protein